MNDPYSPLLALAMVAATVGAAILVAQFSTNKMVNAKRYARVSGCIGLAFALAAGILHIGVVHAPSTPDAMGIVEFVAEHPSLIVVFAVALALLLWSLMTRDTA